MPKAGLASVLALVAVCGAARPARAADAACFDAYERTQRLRKEGKLDEAKGQATICARDTCPALLRKDCTQWVDEIAREMPATPSPETKPVDASKPVESLPPPAVEERRGPPTTSIVLGVVAAVGLVSFVTFAIAGRAEQGCAPDCHPNQISTLRTEYAIADVSWITGLLALGGAAGLWLLQPAPAASAERPHATITSVGPFLGTGAAGLGLGGSF